MLFRDRTAAGRQLALKLSAYANRPDVLVLALPPGGVPVAFEVAQALHAPLDVFLVGKLGVPDVRGRTVILIDDGLTTGASMRAAIAALRKGQPARIVVAVPVGAPETCEEFRAEADDTVCVHVPDPFYAVGVWYDDFSQTTDEEVHDLLQRAADPCVELAHS